MNFKDFAALIHARFNEITAAGEVFHVNASRDDLWSAYLDAFPPGSNPMFRERTEHDCATCRSFVKGVGGIVTIDADLNIQTIWDVSAEGAYAVVAEKMAEFVRCGDIDRVYRTREGAYGSAVTVEETESGRIEWPHFHCTIPQRLRTDNVGAVTGQFASARQVFRRGLTELTLSALEVVEDLILSESLYRGAEHLKAVQGFREVRDQYEAAGPARREAFVWANINNPAARFRNTVIGTLVQDISGGMDLNEAVGRFESKVAPHNYKRSSAPITKGMVDKALATLRELGLEDAVQRRFAVIGDVSPIDVLFVDRDVRPHMKDPLADLLMSEVKPGKGPGKGAVDISGEEFFAAVLPGAEKVEITLEREHLGNFVSLTAPKVADTGRLFQWDNDFAWVYDGEVTDSIKQRVKAAGGNVNALFRVSLSWFNHDDLDIHCRDPSGRHIYYGSKWGILDVDMNAGSRGLTREPVENLAWNRMKDGQYEIWVHQFHKRESSDGGFEIEYEYQGNVCRAAYTKTLRQSQDVSVCTVQVSGGAVKGVAFSPEMEWGGGAAEKWGVSTGQPIPVDTIMLSPNHWGPEKRRRGNKHFIFVLRDCKNPESVRGFFNEYLRSDLHPHRKVFEVLGRKLRCAPSDEQLSGVGFSSTQRAEVMLTVTKGGSRRTYNVRF